MVQISVLITCYNRESQISRAIESVLNSTFQDFEIIVVDDNSDDNSYNLAKKFQYFDTRIKVFKNDVNLGDYQNRNKASEYANGKYLKYLDSDDIIYPHTLSLMYNSMEEFPSAAYGFSFYGVQDNKLPFPYEINTKNAFRLHYLQNGFFYAGPGGAIIRKSCFDEIGKFSGEKYVGDIDLWFRLSVKYSCVVFWPGLIWWNIHEEQENKYEKKSIQAFVRRYELNINMLNSLELDILTKQEVENSIRNYKNLYCRQVLLLLAKLKFKTSLKLFQSGRIPIHFYLFSLFPINRLNKIIKEKWFFIRSL